MIIREASHNIRTIAGKDDPRRMSYGCDGSTSRHGSLCDVWGPFSSFLTRPGPARHCVQPQNDAARSKRNQEKWWYRRGPDRS